MAYLHFPRLIDLKPISKGSKPEDLLIKNIKDGNLSKVKEIIGKHPHIISHDILYDAVSSGKTKMVKFLMSKGCKLKKYNSKRLLYNAITTNVKSSLKMLEYLISQGLSLDFLSKSKCDVIDCCRSPGTFCATYFIRQAIKCGNLLVLKYLIQSGANIYKPGTLFYDCMFIKADCELLEENSFYDSKQEKESSKLIRYLISIGCDPKPEEKLLLTKAILNRDVNLFHLLIEKGCNPGCINLSHGLEANIEIEYIEMVKYFINQGCRLESVPDKITNWIFENKYLDVFKFIVEKTWAYTTFDLKICLGRAFKTKYIEMFEYLIGIGVTMYEHLKPGLTKKRVCWGYRCSSCADVFLSHIIANNDCIVYPRLMTQANFDINNYTYWFSYIYNNCKIPFIYFFNMLTKQNKLNLVREFWECPTIIGIVNPSGGNDIYGHNWYIATAIIGQQITTNKIGKKYNLLKYILKPTSMAMQLTYL
jgi:hypothetical protein